MQKLIVTTDNVIFTIRDNELHVLLVKRATEPFIDHWALPGGKLDTDVDDDTTQASARILKNKTGLSINYLEQIKTYSGNFDPRGYTVSVAHFALTHDAQLDPAVDSVNEARWIPISLLAELKLAFIHGTIIQDAITRLREKAKYSLLPLYCLPKNFTIPAFTNVLGIILGKKIQRKTVQRRLEQVEALREIEGVDTENKRGPASQLYTLNKAIKDITFERNLVN